MITDMVRLRCLQEDAPSSNARGEMILGHRNSSQLDKSLLLPILWALFALSALGMILTLINSKSDMLQSTIALVVTLSIAGTAAFIELAKRRKNRR